MRSWKKQLNKELERTAPALKEEIKNVPITIENAVDDKIERKRFSRRFLCIGSAFAAATAVIVIALLGIFGVFSTPDAPSYLNYVFTLEINPAVVFVTDSEGTVCDVTSLNEDADVILSEDFINESLIGKPLAEAIVTYTDSAARLGYLDLSQESTAVRLSTSSETENELLSEVSSSLRSYFKTNGIYTIIVENTLSINEMCERIGISEGIDLDSLVEKLESIPTRFGEQIDTNADSDAIQLFYKTNIINKETLELIKDELLDNVDKIIQNGQLLVKLKLCNSNIMLSLDNPHFLSDYWTVKEYGESNYNKSFATLMNKMEELLDEYEDTFNVTFSSYDDFEAVEDSYSQLFDSDIDYEKLLSTLTLENFQASTEKYISILRSIGCDVSELEYISTIPYNAQEYISQYRTMLEQLFDSREAKYKNIYEVTRTALSDSKYNDFVNGIISEYGSTDNFWNKNKN